MRTFNNVHKRNFSVEKADNLKSYGRTKEYGHYVLFRWNVLKVKSSRSSSVPLIVFWISSDSGLLTMSSAICLLIKHVKWNKKYFQKENYQIWH